MTVVVGARDHLEAVVGMISAPGRRQVDLGGSLAVLTDHPTKRPHRSRLRRERECHAEADLFLGFSHRSVVDGLAELDRSTRENKPAPPIGQP